MPGSDWFIRRGGEEPGTGDPRRGRGLGAGATPPDSAPPPLPTRMSTPPLSFENQRCVSGADVPGGKLSRAASAPQVQQAWGGGGGPEPEPTEADLPWTCPLAHGVSGATGLPRRAAPPRTGIPPPWPSAPAAPGPGAAWPSGPSRCGPHTMGSTAVTAQTLR